MSVMMVDYSRRAGSARTVSFAGFHAVAVMTRSNIASRAILSREADARIYSFHMICSLALLPPRVAKAAPSITFRRDSRHVKERTLTRRQRIVFCDPKHFVASLRINLDWSNRLNYNAIDMRIVICFENIDSRKFLKSVKIMRKKNYACRELFWLHT